MAAFQTTPLNLKLWSHLCGSVCSCKWYPPAILSTTATISDFGQFFRILGPAPKSLGVSFFSGGVIIVAVQGFFSYRIYAFTKRLYIPILSWSMSFVRFLGTMAIFVTALRMTAISGYEEQWGWLLTIVWCVSVANDLTIAAALVANLISHRSHIHKRTVVLVDKLVVWTIETGMLTSIMAIIVMVCFVTMKDNFIWLGVYVTVPGVFSNSFLASLNSRAKLRAMNDSLPISTSNFAAGSPSGLRASMEQTSKGRQIA
ncbi:hypothetical protein B0H14DRAFT_695446 [Mycena olivaceomarginata]|nr:hypothetical protein B0H14DRAFT_695446 [Mycena olivaceomarginata]